MTDPNRKRYVFREGEYALVLDRKGRRYLVELERSAAFHTHLGNISHDELIGEVEGVRVVSSRGHALLAVKPTMADFTRAMPRIATVVYPKDLGPILVYGDIFPGARVLEAGAGSGAVTIALLRAVGERGALVSYDLRDDMIERTRSNVNAMIPNPVNLVLKQGDVYEGFEEREIDRVVLDLPEPWRVVPHAANALTPGGIFLSFIPTVLQVRDLTLALEENGSFDLIETAEIMMRTWSVGRRSVRPDHRMVGHTGFITTARKCLPRPGSDEDPALNSLGTPG